MSQRGSDWIKEMPYGSNISSIGVQAADILGIAYRGLHHLCREVERVDWSNQRWIEINVRMQMATYDNDLLTWLVLLCHEYCVRMELDNGGPNRIKLVFYPRVREGRISQRHPTIEDAVASVRRYVEFAETAYASQAAASEAIEGQP